MDISYEFNHNEQIISLLIKSFPEFEKNFSIPITFSDEMPPIFHKRQKFERKEKEGKLDDYPIDELMGVYLPRTRNIVIYMQGINRAVNDLSKEINDPNLYENLLTIVILHEIGHYWFYNVKIKTALPTPRINEIEIKECIAQLFVFYCIKNNTELVETMNSLSENQPNEYKTYKCFEMLTLEEFKNVIEKFRNEKPENQTLEEIKKYDIIKFYIDICMYNM